MMKRFVLSLVLGTLLLTPAAVQGQDGATLDLDLRRDFGYGMGGDIQGRFTLTASGPDDLEQVDFLLDGVILSSVTADPFRHSFSTGDYALGVHHISAQGILSDGSRIESRELTVNFVSAEQGWQTVRKMLVPLLLLVAVMTVLGVGLPAFSGRKTAVFRLGQYGPAGGAICPRCRFPYSRHVLAMNLVLGKLERCPHCGKWAIVPAASRRDLDAAEERYRLDSEEGRIETESGGDDLQRLIDESRFES